jgi:4-hydroxy-3-methylbut-2-enyl diphosphate reductase
MRRRNGKKPHQIWAARSDLMIVVGGRNSANTQRLADVCSSITETCLIETASEIQQQWVDGKKHIGITAGASTPDEAIADVVQEVTSLTGTK